MWIEPPKTYRNMSTNSTGWIVTNPPSEHARLAGVGCEDGCQDPHRRGLAGAVRPEQAQHAAGLDRQVDTVQRDDRAEPLDQPARADRRVSHVRAGSAAARTG